MPDGLSLTAGLAFGLAVALLVRLAPLLPQRPSFRVVVIAATSLVVAGLGAAPVWRGLLDGYPGDSFATLSPPAGIGLAGLSLILIGLLFALSLAKAHWLAQLLAPACGRAGFWSTDLVASLALAYLALWLAPQAYYLYYLAIFDGLPWQSVIKPPPGIEAFLSRLLLFESPSLSAHLQGLTGRALLLTSAAPAFLALIETIQRPRGLAAGLLAGGLHLAGSSLFTSMEI